MTPGNDNGKGKGPSDRKMPPRGKPPSAPEIPDRAAAQRPELKKTPGQREDARGLTRDEADEEGRGKGTGNN